MRCTPSSTPPSASSRCSPSATAGTSAASPPPGSTTPDGPTIVIYDGHPGGAGIAEMGFEFADRQLPGHPRRARPLRLHATAARSCVQSPKCGNWNEPLDKAGRRPPHPRRRPPRPGRPSTADHPPGSSTRMTTSAVRVGSPTSAPTSGTSVGHPVADLDADQVARSGRLGGRSARAARSSRLRARHDAARPRPAPPRRPPPPELLPAPRSPPAPGRGRSGRPG